HDGVARLSGQQLGDAQSAQARSACAGFYTRDGRMGERSGCAQGQSRADRWGVLRAVTRASLSTLGAEDWDAASVRLWGLNGRLGDRLSGGLGWRAWDGGAFSG